MGRYLFSDGFGSFLQVCDVVGISIKPCAHVVGNGLVVELPLVSVAQDGLNLVVGRNEDITLVEAPVEGVVLHLTCSSGLLAWCQFETTCNRRQLEVAFSGLEELLRFLFGLFTRDGVGHGSKREDQTKRGQIESDVAADKTVRSNL